MESKEQKRWWEFWIGDAPAPEQALVRKQVEKILYKRRHGLNGFTAASRLSEVLDYLRRVDDHSVLEAAMHAVQTAREEKELSDPHGEETKNILHEILEKRYVDPFEAGAFMGTGSVTERRVDMAQQTQQLFARWDQAGVMEAVDEVREQCIALKWTVEEFIGSGLFADPKYGKTIEHLERAPEIEPFNNVAVMQQFANMLLNEAPADNDQAKYYLDVLDMVKEQKRVAGRWLSIHQENVLIHLLQIADVEVKARAEAEETAAASPDPGAMG